LGNPLNYTRSVSLTFEQFRYAFANVVDEDEARQLYETYSVPAPGAPLFQAAIANLNPWTEAQVNTTNPERGPLLIISGEHDTTVPWAIAHASYKQQEKNPGVTEIQEIPDRGHSLTIDHGWQDTGFQGYAPDHVTIIQPKKKPRGGALTLEEKAQNTAISKQRITVEHSIGGVKVFAIVHHVFRNLKPAFDDLVMETACGLHNLRLDFPIMK